MKSWRNHWPALWLLLILAFVAVARIRLLSLPLERDEGEYAYAGQLMLEGVPPYRLMYNMKMPGIYAAYALGMALFGRSAAGIHFAFMLVNLGCVVLVYFLGRRFLQPAGALAAAAAFALLSLSPGVQGLNAHATHFVVLAALGATLALLRAQERGRLAGFFLSGALFGVAFLMKQPGGAFAFFGLALLLWAAARQSPPAWKAHGVRLGTFAAGAAAPLLLTALLLWRAGVWTTFWRWTVTYAGLHATVASWPFGRAMLAGYLGRLHWDGWFWVLAAAGLAGALAQKNRADEKFFLLALLLFSAAAVCPTFHFTDHYFVLMLPAVALLAAKAFDMAAARLASMPLAMIHWAPWLLFAFSWAGVAWTHRGVFFEWTPAETAARLYPVNNFQVYPVIGAYLGRHASPAAKIAVLGSEPELMFYAHRRSVTGYIYMYDLVQEQPFREVMDGEMIHEVEQGRPDYIVFVNLTLSWRPDPPENLQTMQRWLEDYTDRLYKPYGVVTFPPNLYVWGPDCLRRVPPDHRFVTLFERKDLP
jgi:4-amino-4-deoxy-L-arabinose transferase-like glycosyltransferase